MNNPYLIQRLKKPFEIETNLTKFANAFSFGGGLKNGGLGEEAFNLIKKIWRYDYMGSAEFEWGAVPKSLSRIYSNRLDYTSGEKIVKAYATDYRGAKWKPISKESTVFYICKKADKEQVVDCLAKLATDKNFYRTKEAVCLNTSVCGMTSDIVGWHDLDNDFLFFTDNQMYEQTKSLFNIK